MEKINKVAIIGMGALGALYGDIIAKNTDDGTLYFIADSTRIEKYKNEGVSVNNVIKHFDYKNENDIKENEKPDLLIFAVKGSALEQAICDVKNIVRDDTIIISLLNGISSEEILSRELNSKHIIYCVAQGMDATKLKNKLTYTKPGELRLGIPKKLENVIIKNDFSLLKKFFDEAKVPYIEDVDIMRRMWAKWMLNVGLNQTLMVYEGTYKDIKVLGEIRDTMINAMKEVIELSKCENINLNENDLNEYVELIEKLGDDNMPSMCQDRILKRKTEVELFAGTVIKMAKKYGIDTPVNKKLYDEIKMIEKNF